MSEENSSAVPQLALGDILYVIFRHKWKIVLVCMAGVGATCALPWVKPVPFQSEAALYISSVTERKLPAEVEEGANTRAVSYGGESIINNELQILKSRDLAQLVADALGPERILAKAGGGTNRYQAGGLIDSQLVAEVPRNSTVIRLSFKHPDPEIVGPVLTRLIGFYLMRHEEIHDVPAFEEFMKQETEQLRSRLAQTEEELRKVKAKAGVISLEESKKTYAEELARIQKEILEAEAEWEGSKAGLKALTELRPVAPSVAKTETQGSITNNTASVPAEKKAEYDRVCERLRSLEKQEQELRLSFTDKNVLVKSVQEQIAVSERLKTQLESTDPGLLVMKSAEPGNAASGGVSLPKVDILTETAKVVALESKIQKLTEQLNRIRKEATAVQEEEAAIREWQRKRDLQETHLKHFLENLEVSHIQEKLGRVNIKIIQTPSPPVHAKSKLHKLMAVLLAGSVAGAFALPFLIELYIDQTLKRPADVTKGLRLPLFVSIPQFGSNRSPERLKVGRKMLLPPGADLPNEEEAEATPESSEPDHRVPVPCDLELAPWDPMHQVRPFCDGLRDRLITHFELKNLTHKPKMVAVTSCAEGSGVSTVAAGLAASLSETGDGNVLLVELNPQNGSIRQFFQGGLTCGLEEALASGKRDEALIQDRLYVATETTNRDKLPSVLPKRLRNLVPRLRASDYDYIIFDMPPVNQVSMTPRLAKLMDMVLMVVESEKTNREAAQRANSLLAQSKADVAVVLNKARDYVPRGLQPDL